MYKDKSINRDTDNVGLIPRWSFETVDMFDVTILSTPEFDSVVYRDVRVREKRKKGESLHIQKLLENYQT